eukprot:6987431-Prymnesium_polylepis.1
MASSERARRRARRRGCVVARSCVSRSGPIPRRRILPLLLLTRLPTDGVTRGHGLTLTHEHDACAHAHAHPPTRGYVPACPYGAPRLPARPVVTIPGNPTRLHA